MGVSRTGWYDRNGRGLVGNGGQWWGMVGWGILGMVGMRAGGHGGKEVGMASWWVNIGWKGVVDG